MSEALSWVLVLRGGAWKICVGGGVGVRCCCCCDDGGCGVEDGCGDVGAAMVGLDCDSNSG